MRLAFQVLGIVALIGGVGWIVLVALRDPPLPPWRQAFAYVFSVILALCGVVLVLGAPDKPGRQGPPGVA
jgi:hypothetical protein